MKSSYSTQLSELIRWLNNTNQFLTTGMPYSALTQEAKQITNLICSVANSIRSEYPFYANELPRIAYILFIPNVYGGNSLNPSAFGEVFIICKHLENEPVDVQWWTNIHRRIIGISKELFVQGFYAAAAEKAVKEVEVRLREKFSELKPGTGVPAKTNDIIGALLSENGAFHFCDTSTVSGKDYRRGIQQLFEGTISAYRNPSAHANLDIDRRSAMEQIVLASQLMYVLDSK